MTRGHVPPPGCAAGLAACAALAALSWLPAALLRAALLWRGKQRLGGRRRLDERQPHEAAVLDQLAFAVAAFREAPHFLGVGRRLERRFGDRERDFDADRQAAVDERVPLVDQLAAVVVGQREARRPRGRAAPSERPPAAASRWADRRRRAARRSGSSRGTGRRRSAPIVWRPTPRWRVVGRRLPVAVDEEVADGHGHVADGGVFVELDDPRGALPIGKCSRGRCEAARRCRGRPCVLRGAAAPPWRRRGRPRLRRAGRRWSWADRIPMRSRRLHRRRCRQGDRRPARSRPVGSAVRRLRPEVRRPPPPPGAAGGSSVAAVRSAAIWSSSVRASWADSTRVRLRVDAHHVQLDRHREQVDDDRGQADGEDDFDEGEAPLISPLPSP